MKISQMSTDQAADVLCLIAEPIEVIGTDKDFQNKLTEISKRNKERGRGMNTIESVTSMVGTFVPLLLKNCRAETYAILSALSGKPVAELAAQNVLQTMRDAKDCVDRDLIDFFKSSAGMDGGQSSPQQPQE